MNIFTTLSPALRRNLFVLFTAGLLFWAALTVLLPPLPLYIESIGADSQSIGVVMGSFAIGLLASRSWLAQLADNRGRKLVLLIGMAAVAIAPLGYILTHSIPILIAVRAFHGLSIAAFALAYSALVVDLSLPHHRGELIGYMSLVNPIGMAIGPAMGGYLHEWMGYVPTFLAAAVLGGIGLVFTAQVEESPIIADPQQQHPNDTQFWLLLGDPRIRIPALVLLLVGFAFGTIITFVPLYIQESNVALNVGLLYTAAAIASFSIRLLTGRASDIYGRGIFITLSLVLYGLAMLLLWKATNPTAFLLAGALEGSAGGILIPMMAALMADRSEPNERGRTFSLCMVGFDVGIALAGPVLGAIVLHHSYRFIFGLSTGLAFIGLIVFLLLSSKDIPHSLRFALGRGRDVYAIEPFPFKTKEASH